MKSKKDILLKHVPDIEYELRLSKCNSILKAMEVYKDEFVKENNLKPIHSTECVKSSVVQRFLQLPYEYKRFAELAYKYRCKGCTDDEHEEFEEIRMSIGY